MPIRHANDENNVLDLAHAKDIWSPSMGDCLGGKTMAYRSDLEPEVKF
jgi:hypothetical protein